MANVLASAITINSSWTEGDVHGKRFNCYNITVVLSTQGGATNALLGSVISDGIKNQIVESSNFTLSDNSAIVDTAPSIDGTKLLFGTTVGDQTGTYTGTVKGY